MSHSNPDEALLREIQHKIRAAHKAYLVASLYPTKVGNVGTLGVHVGGLGVYSEAHPTRYGRDGHDAVLLETSGSTFEAAVCQLRCWLREYKPWLLEELVRHEGNRPVGMEVTNNKHAKCTTGWCKEP